MARDRSEPTAWWLLSQVAFGRRGIIRPLNPPTQADRAKFWEADLQDIADDAKDSVVQCRGARGLVDPKLPDAVKTLDKARQDEEKHRK